MFDVQEQFDLNYSIDPSGPPCGDHNLIMGRFNEAADEVRGSHVIYPQFKILSADKPTRNLTSYSLDAHKGNRAKEGVEACGQHSLTSPYPIPVISEHRRSPGMLLPESEIFGRIIGAKLIKSPEYGSAHVAGLGEISHPEAVDQILSGRWLTGSLGSEVHKAHCSICGHEYENSRDLQDHLHQKAHYYTTASAKDSDTDAMGYRECDPKEKSAQLCYTSVDKYSAREYSRVIVPSDDESVVQITDTRLQPGSHWSGMPAIADKGIKQDVQQPSSRESATVSLWIPMKESSREACSVWGERYIDLISGRERLSSELGLLCGTALYEHIDIMSSAREAKTTLTLEDLSFNESDGATVFAVKVDLKEEETVKEAVLSTQARKNLLKKSPSVFCGPVNPKTGKPSFPVENKAHYEAALRLLKRWTGGGNKARIKACILSKGRKNGWASK